MHVSTHDTLHLQAYVLYKLVRNAINQHVFYVVTKQFGSHGWTFICQLLVNLVIINISLWNERPNKCSVHISLEWIADSAILVERHRVEREKCWHMSRVNMARVSLCFRCLCFRCLCIYRAIYLFTEKIIYWKDYLLKRLFSILSCPLDHRLGYRLG